MIRAISVLLLAACATSACSNTVTSPSTATTQSDQFNGFLDLQAAVPYTLQLVETTNVNLTFASLVDSDGNVSQATVAMSVGTPAADSTCTPTTTMNVKAQLTAQMKVTLNPGNYCVNVADIGNLVSASVFVVRVVIHPAIQTTPATNTTETFSSNVAVGGFASRTFDAFHDGTISLTLQSLSPASTVGFGLGIPSLSGAGCSLTTVVQTSGGSTPQITAPADAGSYCVKVFDTGSLVPGPSGTTSFSSSIVHP